MFFCAVKTIDKKTKKLYNKVNRVRICGDELFGCVCDPQAPEKSIIFLSHFRRKTKWNTVLNMTRWVR